MNESPLGPDEWKKARSILESLQPKFDLTQALFPRQLPFAQEARRWSTAVCTRRAGKTYACAAKLLSVAMAKPGCVALYITLSRLNAKRIVWETLKALNNLYSLGGVPTEGDLCVAFPNGSKVYLSGCIDASEVDKFLGLPIGIVVIDEAQSFPVFLERLVDEVLSGALADYDGQIVMIGTPGPVPIGYYHACVTNPKWAHHQWTIFDNPHIRLKSGKEPQQLLQEELERRGVTVDDPSIQRAWFARWALDSNSLVFRYDEAKNHRTLPAPFGRELFHQHHVIGVDFGYYDADAIAVLGWSDDSPSLDLVEEVVTPKQFLTPLMNKVLELQTKYSPLAIVADFASFGMKIAGELSMRTSVPVEAAEKTRKLEHIELLNDALRVGRFFAPKTSRFAHDCMLVEWDRTNPEKPKISDRFHSDINDAVLYAYRKALHWLHVPASTPPPKVGTVEWREAEAKRQEAENEAMLQADINAARERRESDSNIADIL